MLKKIPRFSVSFFEKLNQEHNPLNNQYRIGGGASGIMDKQIAGSSKTAILLQKYCTQVPNDFHEKLEIKYRTIYSVLGFVLILV